MSDLERKGSHGGTGVGSSNLPASANSFVFLTNRTFLGIVGVFVAHASFRVFVWGALCASARQQGVLTQEFVADRDRLRGGHFHSGACVNFDDRSALHPYGEYA